MKITFSLICAMGFALCTTAFAAGGQGSNNAGAASRGGQMSASGAQRFRQDLAECNTMAGGEKQSCLKEMYAARAQGLYRD